ERAGMRRLSLVATGLAIALSVSAQTIQTTRPNERKRALDPKQSANVLHSTTVFRNGHETNEHIDLHQSFREPNDLHFGIGFHDRAWWLRNYSILLMGGCYFYLADDGCWYPAHGFHLSCYYPIGVVYCE